MKTKHLSIFIFSVSLIFSCGKNNNETKPERRSITETTFASGTLEPEGKYNLTAQTEGYILELKFDDGDLVKSGQVLVIVENKSNNISASTSESLLNLLTTNAGKEGPTLKQAQQNIQILREKNVQDSLLFARYQKLSQSNSVSKLELENVKLAFETSRTNLSNANQNYRLLSQQIEQQLLLQQSQRDLSSVSNENNQIKAVVGGRIYRKLKEPGDYVRRGDVIAIIGNPEELYAKLNIDESNIRKVKPGQIATIQLNTNKEINYEGEVSEILPAFDDASQSFICKIKLKRQPELKIVGTQLQANIIVGTKANALVMPRNFLDYGNRVKVKGTDEPILIKTGFVSNEWVEIIEGVKESDILINQNR